jgi:hypothetical protein
VTGPRQPASRPGLPVALGRLVATPGALELAEAQRIDLGALVARHRAGDWGDVCREDARANDAALRHGERLLSSYGKGTAGHLWIITEADRSSTCILRPDDY